MNHNRYLLITDMKSVLIMLLLICFVQTELYRRVIHNYDPEAKCLDGTPGLLYVHEGGDTKNILIFMEGGGFCGDETLNKTLESCYQRSKTLLGSSNYWPEFLQGEGYLSTDSSVSRFANWTKFIFGYCDGALHQGFSKTPIKYKDSQLYFRGSLITKSHFNWIDSKYKLKNATRVILTGGSAGSVGVHLWNNYLRTFLNPSTLLYSIGDSGVFLNFKTTSGNAKIQKAMINIFKLANTDEQTPLTDCNNGNRGNEWRCIFIENIYLYIKGKYLVINSEYDSWAISNILEVKCLKQGISGQTLSSCTKSQLNQIEKYRAAYREALTKLLVANSEASIWSIACSNHVYACINIFYNSQFQKVPEIVGNSVSDAINKFVLGNERVISYDVQAWPSNQLCAK